MLTIPETGLNLKTKIYVAVKATNLTDRYLDFDGLLYTSDIKTDIL